MSIVNKFPVNNVKLFISYQYNTSSFLYFYRLFCNVGLYKTSKNINTLMEEKE